MILLDTLPQLIHMELFCYCYKFNKNHERSFISNFYWKHSFSNTNLFIINVLLCEYLKHFPCKNFRDKTLQTDEVSGVSDSPWPQGESPSTVVLLWSVVLESTYYVWSYFFLQKYKCFVGFSLSKVRRHSLRVLNRSLPS